MLEKRLVISKYMVMKELSDRKRQRRGVALDKERVLSH